MFNNIIDPTSGKNFSITSKSGLEILKKYIYQLGGHNGPCAMGKKGRCAKSSKADGKCEVSPKGRCRKIKSQNKPQFKISKQEFYNSLSEYWGGPDSNKYKALKIYENIEELLDNISLSKHDLKPENLLILEFFYDVDYKNYLDNTLNEKFKKVATISEDSLSLFKKVENVNIEAEYKQLTNQLEQLNKQERKIDDIIIENENTIRTRKLKNLALKFNIDSSLNFSELENILYEKGFLSDEEFDKLDIEINKENMKMLKNRFNTRDELNKQIRNLRSKRMNLRKKKFIERPLTSELISQRLDVENMAFQILHDFFEKEGILQAALIELSNNQFKWNSSKYNLFSISPIKEAVRKLNGEVPFNRDSIESSGFIPFTIKKFSDMYPELDDLQLKNMEINWWVDFLESGKSIHDELSNTGINFIKVY